MTPSAARVWRIGTRGSPLALAQAEEVRSLLIKTHRLPEDSIEIVPIRTSGDRIQDRPLAEAGGKGLFTKEIEEALLAGLIDLAVHSAKDLPTALPSGLQLSAVLEREDPRDALIGVKSLSDLPSGAIVGTSSLRRGALVLRARPDVQIIGFRGNVETRLKKLAEGQAQATLLAIAGLKRLNRPEAATGLLETETFPPAVGQGVIAIETRVDDAATCSLLAVMDHTATHVALLAERAFLGALDGSCRTPIAGLARLREGMVFFEGLIITPDGTRWHATTRAAIPSDAAAAGADAGDELRALGGPGFFQ